MVCHQSVWIVNALVCLCTGDPLLACRWADPNSSAVGPRSRRPPLWPPRASDPEQGPPPASPRGGGRLGREFHSLPLEQKVVILDRLTGHLLDVHPVREVCCSCAVLETKSPRLACACFRCVYKLQIRVRGMLPPVCMDTPTSSGLHRSK